MRSMVEGAAARSFLPIAANCIFSLRFQRRQPPRPRKRGPPRNGVAITGEENSFRVVAQERRQQRRHLFRLLLLHPMSRAVHQIETHHVRAGA